MIKRLLVALLAASSLWALSLIVASATGWDSRLGIAPVVCPEHAFSCESLAKGETYDILWLPWPPINWYSLIAAFIGGTVGWILSSAPRTHQREGVGNVADGTPAA